MSLLTRAERVAIEIRNLPTCSAKRRPPEGGLSITLTGARPAISEPDAHKPRLPNRSLPRGSKLPHGKGAIGFQGEEQEGYRGLGFHKTVQPPGSKVSELARCPPALGVGDALVVV